mmetsp:Transcript_10442/g.25236  ORF Transcript_10442/g.25236 Transcript_10442/m.25236 type:complete len:232 (-) Transcript_10442:274-969(-)
MKTLLSGPRGPLKKILLTLSVMQLLTSTVQGQSAGLEDQPFGHPYIHQHGHHPVNHPQSDNEHHRHSKKRGSKRNGNSFHPWDANHLHSLHGKHSKRQGPNNNRDHHDEHSETEKNDNHHSDSHVVPAESNTKVLPTPLSTSSLSSSDSVSLSSLSSSSSFKAKNEEHADETNLPANNKDEVSSMGGIEVEALRISQAKPFQTRIETETKHHPDSIETNVISVHAGKHGEN